MLISSFALGRYPRDAGFLTVSWDYLVVEVDGVIASPGQMHDNPTTYNRGRVIWTGKAVDVQGTHHTSNVCAVRIPPLIQLAVRSLSYSAGRAWRMMSSYRSSGTGWPYPPDARDSRSWCKENRRDRRQMSSWHCTSIRGMPS